MKILLCGGAKTPNIANALRPRFKKGGVEILVETSIDDIKNLLDRGEYFDRAVVMEPGWTNDNADTNEYSVRERMARFIEIVRNYASRVTGCIFVTTSESMAEIVAEESIIIGNQCKILIKRPPYNVAFCISLVTSNLDEFDPSLVFELQPEDTTEIEQKIVYSTPSREEQDSEAYDLEQVGEFQFKGDESIDRGTSSPEVEDLRITPDDVKPAGISDFDLEFDGDIHKRENKKSSFEELEDEFSEERVSTVRGAGVVSSPSTHTTVSFEDEQDREAVDSEAKASGEFLGFDSMQTKTYTPGQHTSSIEDMEDMEDADTESMSTSTYEPEHHTSSIEDEGEGFDDFDDVGDEEVSVVDMESSGNSDSIELDEEDTELEEDTESGFDLDKGERDKLLAFDDEEASSDSMEDTSDNSDDFDDELSEPEEVSSGFEDTADTEEGYSLDKPDTAEAEQASDAGNSLTELNHLFGDEEDAGDDLIELDETSSDAEDGAEYLEEDEGGAITEPDNSEDTDLTFKTETETSSVDDVMQGLFGGSDGDSEDLVEEDDNDLVFHEDDIQGTKQGAGESLIEDEAPSHTAPRFSQIAEADAKPTKHPETPQIDVEEQFSESSSNSSNIASSVSDLFGLSDNSIGSGDNSSDEQFGRGMYIKNDVGGIGSEHSDEAESSGKKQGKRSILGGLIKKSAKGSESDEKKLKTILNTFRNRGSSLVVTGTPCSGTSTLVFNLANIVSNMGYTVLIVDMDTVNRTQAYMSKVAYESVHSLDPENASLKQALNASNSGISKYASIVKPGFHVLTMGLGGDIVTGERLAPKQKLARFSSSVRNNYNFIIYDMPFNVATDYASDITYTADNVVLACEASNHGIMGLMLAMCNIDSEDMQEVMFTRSQLCLTKYTQLKRVLDCNISSVRDILRRLDTEVSSLLGIDPEYYFSNLSVCGIMNYDEKYENGWFSDRAYSDYPEGREEFIKLLTNILLKK